MALVDIKHSHAPCRAVYPHVSVIAELGDSVGIRRRVAGEVCHTKIRKRVAGRKVVQAEYTMANWALVELSLSSR